MRKSSTETPRALKRELSDIKMDCVRYLKTVVENDSITHDIRMRAAELILARQLTSE